MNPLPSLSLLSLVTALAACGAPDDADLGSSDADLTAGETPAETQRKLQSQFMKKLGGELKAAYGNIEPEHVEECHRPGRNGGVRCDEFQYEEYICGLEVLTSVEPTLYIFAFGFEDEARTVHMVESTSGTYRAGFFVYDGCIAEINGTGAAAKWTIGSCGETPECR